MTKGSHAPGTAQELPGAIPTLIRASLIHVCFLRELEGRLPGHQDRQWERQSTSSDRHHAGVTQRKSVVVGRV